MEDKETKEVDFDRLRRLYKHSGAARAVLDHFASRERNWASTTVDRIQANVAVENPNVSRADVIAVFRELDESGCGVFRTGRKGWPSRFEWRLQMVSVGQAAAGETDRIEQITADDAGVDSTETIKHSFRLRRDVTVSFELPSNLTAPEANRLAEFLRTLPFTD